MEWIQYAEYAQQFAQCKISNYPVGAALKCKNGDIFLGFNVEFPGAAIQNTLHAEQFAVVNAYIHGVYDFETLAITAAPCGYCRQFLAERIEVSRERDLTILLQQTNQNTKDVKSYSLLNDLLPYSWAGAKELYNQNGDCCENNHDKTMFAPFSGSESSCVLENAHGVTFRGSYIESPSFNASIPPFQSAFISFANAHFELCISKDSIKKPFQPPKNHDLFAAFQNQIVKITLTQQKDCKIDQYLHTLDALKSVHSKMEINSLYIE